MIHRRRVLALALCAALAWAAPGSGQVLVYSLFERYIDSLRQQTGIPGMSVLIVKNGQVDWERGFGKADLDRNILAAPDTPYPIGDLSQAFSAVLMGACAEQGLLNIDAPMNAWVPDFPAPTATLRQVLAHASTGQFQYDAGRYAQVGAALTGCTPKPYRTHLADSVLERLGMAASVPGEDLGTSGSARELFEPPRLQRYDDVLARLAVPYRVDRNLRASRSDRRPGSLTTAGGIVSTVRDLARFEAALDDAVLLRPETLAVAWSPTVVDGATLPTGLGWFVQNYQGARLIWHFSYVPDAYSGLILKMPERQLTLIMLANSDGLTTGANLDQGDVTASPFVKIFLRLFA